MRRLGAAVGWPVALVLAACGPAPGRPAGVPAHVPGPIVAEGRSGAAAAPADAQALADSERDFSGVQGAGGWSYGYVEPATGPDFIPMRQFVDQTWYVNLGVQWTHVGVVEMHPNGSTTSGGRIPIEQWAVRRWVSTVAGPVTISGKIARAAASNSQPVLGKVLVDGMAIYSQVVQANDTTGFSFSQPAMLKAGSTVDLVLAPQGADFLGGTRFTARIAR